MKLKVIQAATARGAQAAQAAHWQGYSSIGEALRSQFAILSGFSKGIDGAAAINYAPSGGPNCDPKCPLLGAGCYAERAELRPDRSQLAAKLRRHGRTDPAILTQAARLELQRRIENPTKRAPRPPWFRISTNGSVPNRISRDFGHALRAILELCRRESIPVHFPVETAAKAARYRRAVRDLAVVRESTDDRRRFLSARGAVSYVAGEKSHTRVERIAQAKQAARERTARTGRRCIVCPAVVQSSTITNYAARFGKQAAALKRATMSPAKCGACVACAVPAVDIVYPLH